MKKLITIFLCIMAFVTFASGENQPEDISFPIQNNPLPTNNDTLRVLLIGNSFTDDATQYIDNLIISSEIDPQKCCIYILYEGGYSILHWWNRYNRNETFQLVKRGGAYEMVSTGTIQELLHQNWDVVGLQQTSDYSTKIESFSPYLYDIIRHIKNDCTNTHVSICWQLSWSYWSDIDKDGPKEKSGWEEIVATTDQMISLYGIDIIIPSGTAVENARTTLLNTEHSLTRDGHHIAYGTGHYLLACTLFETLFKPTFGISVLNNTARPTISEAFKEKSQYEYCEVTDESALLCQLCAINAVEDWHTISTSTDIATIASSIPAFIAFPNPSSNKITIQYSNTFPEINTGVQIHIIDQQGQLLLCQEEDLSDEITIDISNFPNNQFFIQIVYNGKTSIIPIIKTK
ncbi:MAG: DUF4886 domain-containing protein [Bacteroidales bacterium]|nr:DUF4886 domain-containing protein [Bacteroidales bacterium]